MTQPTGTRRALPFGLTFTLDMDSSTADESILFNTLEDWPTTDSSERVNIVLNLSLNEYVALASTIDVGRDIAFGDNSISIWWLWTRSMLSMDICQAIIDCINDTESGVAQEIVTTITNSSSTEMIDSGQSQANLIFGLDNNPACDLDILWGGINHLVDQLDVNNLDALQILEVATNSVEWATDVLGGVLGIKAPIINSVLEWALFIQDSILENYEAQITVTYMDTLKCELFCIAQDNNCELTPQLLVDYFFGRLASSLTFGNLLWESLGFIFGGVWTGSEIADAMMLSQLVFRAQFGSWFQDVTFRAIDLDMRLGFDNPSDDWELLCTECSVTLRRLNGNGNADMIAITYAGTIATYIDPPQLYQGAFGSPSSIYIQIEFEFDSATDIQETTWRFSAHRTTGTGLNGISLFLDDVSVDFVSVPTTEEEEIYTLSWSGSQSVTKIRILGGINIIEEGNGNMNLISVTVVTDT